MKFHKKCEIDFKKWEIAINTVVLKRPIKWNLFAFHEQNKNTKYLAIKMSCNLLGFSVFLRDYYWV